MDVKKTVLITGGTSGIGLAAAEIFLENGWRAVIVGRDVGRGNCAVRMLKKHSEDVMFVSGDVRTCDGCKDIVEKAISAGSRIDFLVSSAGIYFEKGIMEMSESDYDDIMSVNVRGTYFMAQAAIPELRRHQGASIVNIASDAGLHGNYLCTAYCASKGAVVLFTKALALELAPQIRVNCVCPGDIMTPLTKQQLGVAGDRDKALDEMASVYPMHRIGKAREAAAAIWYLASDDAGFITGTSISVDGGITA